MSGIHLGIGIHGALAFLVDQKWSEVEVLYVGEQHAVFLAGGIGHYGPMNYLYQGALRGLQLTALNSQAKQMVKDKYGKSCFNIINSTLTASALDNQEAIL